MNDRIRQLIKQAGVYYNDSDYDHSDLEALQKFAELIIHECKHAIIQAHSGYINPKIVVEALDKHFGIKNER